MVASGHSHTNTRAITPVHLRIHMVKEYNQWVSSDAVLIHDQSERNDIQCVYQ